MDRIPHAENDPACKSLRQKVVQTHDMTPMPWPTRGHLDDLSFKKFHPRILIEDPGLGHEMIFIYGEEMAL
jgi:hypothetical protein